MAERALRRRLGVFVAATIAALTGLIVLFGGAPTVFNARTKYTVLYPEAPGVAAGTPVRKSGVRIGRVTAGIQNASAGGAIQQPGIEIRQPQMRREPPRQSALARRRRPIHGDDERRHHAAAITAIPAARFINSEKLGKLVAMKAPSSTCMGTALPSPSTSALMARR